MPRDLQCHAVFRRWHTGSGCQAHSARRALSPPHLVNHAPSAPIQSEEPDTLTASDELEPLAVLRSKHKQRSFAYAPAAGRRAAQHAAQLVLALANNSLEVRGDGRRGWEGLLWHAGRRG